MCYQFSNIGYDSVVYAATVVSHHSVASVVYNSCCHDVQTVIQACYPQKGENPKIKNKNKIPPAAPTLLSFPDDKLKIFFARPYAEVITNPETEKSIKDAAQTKDKSLYFDIENVNMVKMQYKYHKQCHRDFTRKPKSTEKVDK